MQEIGPYIIFSHEEGDFELGWEAVLKKLAVARGFPLDQNVTTAIKNIVKEESKRIKEQLRNEGFPENIKMLFDAKKKHDSERISRGITISNSDIARMVFNCDLVGFKYQENINGFILRK